MSAHRTPLLVNLLFEALVEEGLEEKHPISPAINVEACAALWPPLEEERDLAMRLLRILERRSVHLDDPLRILAARVAEAVSKTACSITVIASHDNERDVARDLWIIASRFFDVATGHE